MLMETLIAYNTYISGHQTFMQCLCIWGWQLLWQLRCLCRYIYILQHSEIFSPHI